MADWLLADAGDPPVRETRRFVRSLASRSYGRQEFV
jgi:hypothetical protein